MRRPTLLIVFSSALLLLGAGLAKAQGQAVDAGQRLVVPLSTPDRPVKLDVDLFSGSIEVVGYDGAEVVVVARMSSREMRSDTADGMRRIPNTALGLTVEERDNDVRVSGEWHDRTIQVTIQVPFATSAHVSTVNHGDITVRELTGELELENTNGGIEAMDISGSVVANTTNGDVKISFLKIMPDKAMAFTTLNGDVDVAFPDGFRANLRISPGRGEILTDFEVDVQPTEPEISRGESGGTYRVEMGSDVHATVGGGGPTFRFKTFNGDVYIRKMRM